MSWPFLRHHKTKTNQSGFPSGSPLCPKMPAKPLLLNEWWCGQMNRSNFADDELPTWINKGPWERSPPPPLANQPKSSEIVPKFCCLSGKNFQSAPERCTTCLHPKRWWCCWLICFACCGYFPQWIGSGKVVLLLAIGKLTVDWMLCAGSCHSCGDFD